jgi:hypothetical protein
MKESRISLGETRHQPRRALAFVEICGDTALCASQEFRRSRGQSKETLDGAVGTVKFTRQGPDSLKERTEY